MQLSEIHPGVQTTVSLAKEEWMPFNLTKEAQEFLVEPSMLPVKPWNCPSIRGPIFVECDPKLGAN